MCARCGCIDVRPRSQARVGRSDALQNRGAPPHHPKIASPILPITPAWFPLAAFWPGARAGLAFPGVPCALLLTLLPNNPVTLPNGDEDPELGAFTLLRARSAAAGESTMLMGRPTPRDEEAGVDSRGCPRPRRPMEERGPFRVEEEEGRTDIDIDDVIFDAAGLLGSAVDDEAPRLDPPMPARRGELMPFIRTSLCRLSSANRTPT